MGNHFYTHHCKPLSDSIDTRIKDSWSANEEPGKTDLPSREISSVQSEFSDQAATSTYQPFPDNTPLFTSLDHDPVEADFLTSESTFSDDEDSDDETVFPFPGSPEIKDEELNSDAPSLAGLTWTLKSTIPLPPLPDSRQILMTGLQSILTGTECNYGEFKSMINKRSVNRYTPVIQSAINRISEQKLINDHEPMKHYAQIIQHFMHVAFLQLYSARQVLPPAGS